MNCRSMKRLAAYLRSALAAILSFAEKSIEEVGIYEVAAVVASKTGIPIGKIQSQEEDACSIWKTTCAVGLSVKTRR